LCENDLPDVTPASSTEVPLPNVSTVRPPVSTNVRIAFEERIETLLLSQLLPLNAVSPELKQSAKYKQIANSVAEVGIIEPLVVARSSDQPRHYLLLDGHIRHAVLADAGETEVRCLIALDDEAFTYNKRINRLATIQEHFMIVRAIERGVSEDKLAKALDLDVKAIRRRRTMLGGICPEVVDLLKDKSLNPTTFDVLRKMKPMRQIEAADLMSTAGNYTASYAKALLAATRQADLVKSEQPKKVGGLTTDQMARMEREIVPASPRAPCGIHRHRVCDIARPNGEHCLGQCEALHWVERGPPHYGISIGVGSVLCGGLRTKHPGRARSAGCSVPMRLSPAIALWQRHRYQLEALGIKPQRPIPLPVNSTMLATLPRSLGGSSFSKIMTCVSLNTAAMVR